jgi:adenine-specific DNA-methyltransferase
MKHESERFTLYCADAVDVLDTLDPRSVGLIATDPPYGVKWQSNFRKGSKLLKIANDGAGYDAVGVVAAYVKHVLMPQRHLYVFGSTVAQREQLMLGGACDLVWDKGNIGLGDLSLPWGPQHEMILFGVYVPSKQNRDDGKGALSARLRAGSVLRVDRPNSKAVKKHPTEKPVELMRQLIESSTSVDDVVLDMFAGSGSTLVAAILSGRKAIGVEIEREYCATIFDRCTAAEALWRAGSAL